MPQQTLDFVHLVLKEVTHVFHTRAHRVLARVTFGIEAPA